MLGRHGFTETMRPAVLAIRAITSKSASRWTIRTVADCERRYEAVVDASNLSSRRTGRRDRIARGSTKVNRAINVQRWQFTSRAAVVWVLSSSALPRFIAMGSHIAIRAASSDSSRRCTSTAAIDPVARKHSNGRCADEDHRDQSGRSLRKSSRVAFPADAFSPSRARRRPFNRRRARSTAALLEVRTRTCA